MSARANGVVSRSLFRVWRWLLAWSVLLALLVPHTAAAHGGNSGPIQSFTQSVGPYELVVMLEMPSAAPGTLFIDVTPQQPIDGVRLQLRAAPRGQPLDNAPVAELQGLPGAPAVYYTQLDLDRVGDWDLEIQADGPAGSGVARIPFTITAVPIPAATLGLFAAFGLLAVLLLANIVLALVYRAPRKPPAWATTTLGYAMFGCLVVAGVLGVQQFLDGRAQALTQPVAAGRPHVNMALSTTPGQPSAGQPVTLTIDLSDGSTGLPVDDLLPHHEALMHLIVLDQTGAFMEHLHPPRVAPGQFVMTLTPDRPGNYTAYAEIERRDSGTQVLSRDFAVSGAPVAAPAAAPGLGLRQIGDLAVAVAASNPQPRAGETTTLTFSFKDGDRPVQDIQPWLGMAGHLIARSDDRQIFAHIHAAERMIAPGPTAAGERFGPDIRFVYTFPQPGDYQLWAQFKHHDQIITVPLELRIEN